MEVAVATALLSLGISLVGTVVFQVLGAQSSWQDDMVAAKDLRHVGSWISGEVLDTDTTNLVIDDPAVNTVMLTTFDGDQITYSLSVPNLIRAYDDGSVVTLNTRSSKAASVAFSQSSADLVTLVLVVKAKDGGNETITLNTNLR